jgi:hypothetical protein
MNQTEGAMKIYRFLSLLLLGVVVLSGFSCRDDECKVDYPSVAYVNDEIVIKMRLFTNGIFEFWPLIAIQIPEDWEFLSLTSDVNYVSLFQIYNSVSIDAEENIGLKKGYKWIGGGPKIPQHLFILNATIEIKLKIGNKSRSALLDFAARDALQGSQWIYKIQDLPIMIYDQKVNLTVQPPCSSKDSESELFLNFENRDTSKNADLYFVLMDNKGDFYSYPDWHVGIIPFVKNITIPEGTKIDNAKILDITYPSESPLITDTGYYTFYLATAEPDSTNITGELGNAKYYVGNQNPVPNLIVRGIDCDGVQIEFDASGSHDFCDTDDELLVRFDYEGDGVWDTDFQTQKIVNYAYKKPGDYVPTIEVKDTTGLVVKCTAYYDGYQEVGARQGQWKADVWYQDEYFNFTINSNVIEGSYNLVFMYGGYPVEPWYETKTDTFSITYNEEEFYYKTDWGSISFEFVDCSNIKLSIQNIEDDVYDGDRNYNARRVE